MNSNQKNKTAVFFDSFLSDTPVFPYVISVVGHRDFATPSKKVESLMESILCSFSKKWEDVSGGDAPLVVLTGLADGADQMTAEVVDKLKKERPNIKQGSILPFDSSLYRNTIKNQSRFDQLFQKSDFSHVIPFVPEVEENRELLKYQDNAEGERLRRLQYVELTNFLALYSHAMIAVWDGVDLPDDVGIGGTSYAVRLKLEGTQEKLRDERFDPLTFPYVGSVIQIKVKRSAKGAEPAPGTNNATKIGAYSNSAGGNSTEDVAPPVFVWTKAPVYVSSKKTARSSATEAASFKRCELELNHVSNEIGNSTKDNALGKIDDSFRFVDLQKIAKLSEIDNIDEIAEDAAFSSVLSAMGGTNADIGSFSAKIPRFEERIQTSQDYLGLKLSAIGNSKEEKKKKEENDIAKRVLEDKGVRILLRYFAFLDVVSDYLQTRRTYRVIAKYIAVFLLLMITSGVIGVFWSIRQNQWGKDIGSAFNFLWREGSASPFDVMHCLSVAFWLFFAALVVLYCRAKGNKYHHRYHRCRALAEALRIQIFWRIAGVSDVVSTFYRSYQNNDLEWLRSALNCFSLIFPLFPQNTIDVSKRVEFIQKHWIEDQYKYFEKGVKRRKNISIKESKPKNKDFLGYASCVLDCFLRFVASNKIINVVIVAGLIALFALHPILGNFFDFIYGKSDCKESLIYWFVIIGIVCSISVNVYLASQIYVQLKRYKREAIRFERMIYPFDRASFLLDALLDRLKKEPRKEMKVETEVKRVLRDLGVEALAENAEWLLSVEERELALPR